MKKTNGNLTVIKQKRSILDGEVLTHILVEEKEGSAFSICVKYRDEFVRRKISTSYKEGEKLFRLISVGRVTPVTLDDIIDDCEA